jgi:hypothetical protein
MPEHRKTGPDDVLDPLREALKRVMADGVMSGSDKHAIRERVTLAVEQLQGERSKAEEAWGDLVTERNGLQGELEMSRFNERAWDRLAVLIGDVRREMREVGELYEYAADVGCLT